MIIDLPRPLAVVCHDAGATNVILSWIAAEQPSDVRLCLHGPAARLHSQWQIQGKLVPDVAEALDGAAALLSGSGWGGNIEHQARSIAKQRGIYSAAVLDHWVVYPERFTRNDSVVLPDAFWVTDAHAFAIAEREFPRADIRMKENLYIAREVSRIAPVPAAGTDLLYILEPARRYWGGDLLGEFQALDYFVRHRHEVDGAAELPIRLRPHPSDEPGKYDDWLEAHRDLPIQLSTGKSLAEDISGAAIVAGMESVALVIALLAGRRVISTLPPWAPQCALPHDEIIHLKDLVEMRAKKGGPVVPDRPST